MQHFGPVIRQLRGFAHVELRHDARGRHQTRIGRHEPGHILPQRNPLGAECAAQHRRGQVAAAPPQRDQRAIGGPADEPRHDGEHPLLEQRTQLRAHLAIGGVEGRKRAAEHAVGADQGGRLDVCRLRAAGEQAGHHETRRELFAAHQQKILRARRQLAQAGHTVPERAQFVEGRREFTQQSRPRPGVPDDPGGDDRVPLVEPAHLVVHRSGVSRSRRLGDGEQRIRHPGQRRHHGNHPGRARLEDQLDSVANGRGIGQRGPSELENINRGRPRSGTGAQCRHMATGIMSPIGRPGPTHERPTGHPPRLLRAGSPVHTGAHPSTFHRGLLRRDHSESRQRSCSRVPPSI